MMKKRSGDCFSIIYTSHTITWALITKKWIICMWNSAVSQECHQVFSCFLKLSYPVIRHCWCMWRTAWQEYKRVIPKFSSTPPPYIIWSQPQLANQRPLSQERFLWNTTLGYIFSEPHLLLTWSTCLTMPHGYCSCGITSQKPGPKSPILDKHIFHSPS